LVEKKRLIQLLDHEDERVITAAAGALARFFPGSKNIITHLLRIDNIDIKTKLTLLAKIKNFVPTEDDIREIIYLFTKFKDNTGLDAEILRLHIISTLLEFPFPVLEKNFSTFAFNEELLGIYEMVKEQEEIKSLEPDVLWENLEKLCLEYHDYDVMDSEDGEYAEALVKALSEKGGLIKHKIVMYLSQGSRNNYSLEFCLVRLAGKLRLKETVPYLFRILTEYEPADLINESCIHTLGEIGTPEVVETIGKLYPVHEDIRGFFADILEAIPYPCAEDMAIKLIKKEHDIENKTFLADALCSIFSIKSSDVVIDIIRKKQYNPILMSLLDNLVPVYVYHGKTIDNMVELEKISKEYNDEFDSSDPFYQMIKQRRARASLKSWGDPDDYDNSEDDPDEEEGEIIEFPGKSNRSSSKKKNKRKKQ
jgi:HEAT repeat protein